MRLFVAFGIPSRVRREIWQRAAELRPRLPPARWVRPDGLHLTLTFLGEVDEGAVAALDRCLRERFAGAHRFAASARGGGTFPPDRPARVAWVGVDLRPDVANLQDELRRASAETLDRPPSRRPFHPHLTLARCRRPWPRTACELWSEAMGAVPEGAFTIDRGTLFESRLGRDGAHYTALAEYPLASGSTGGATGGSG